MTTKKKPLSPQDQQDLASSMAMAGMEPIRVGPRLIAGRMQFIPEPNWRLRRIVVWGLLIAFTVFLGIALHGMIALKSWIGLTVITVSIIVFMLVILLVYLVAPSAQYVRSIAEVVEAGRGH